MASACVNNNMAISTENNFSPPSSYKWLKPRVSTTATTSSHEEEEEEEEQQQQQQDSGDFEFRLEDPVTSMLPADELFSDGKLVPLKLAPKQQEQEEKENPPVNALTGRSRAVVGTEGKCCRRVMEMEVSGMMMDPYVFSPKAPRCTTRWKELLGLKKLNNNNNNNSATKTASFSFSSSSPSRSSASPKTSSFVSSSAPGPASNKTSSLKQFLHRSSKSSATSAPSLSSSEASALNLPLLSKDSEGIYETTLSISSSRLSLSSSSSSGGHDHLDDLPRLSLDTDNKPSPSPNPFAPARPRMRMVKPQQDKKSSSTTTNTTTATTVSIDSPRLNSSGKIVFHGLERSSSSPSSFNNGGPRYKHRGMERSYSANVRVTPVLNVPVCSLRGSSKSGIFGQLFSSSTATTGTGGSRGQQQSHGKNRTERT